MLRVGLTGGLGSGKSTVAQMLAERGAHVLSADDIGRELMQPGQAVFAAIVEHFGSGVVAADGSLDRAALAKIAFADGRVEELNAIVHPATIARQAELMAAIAAHEPAAVVVVESALIFETAHGGGGGWPRRFDKLVLVRATEERKIARFIERASKHGPLVEDAIAELKAEAVRRLARQLSDEVKAPQCDYVLENDGSLENLQAQVDALWPVLLEAATHPA